MIKNVANDVVPTICIFSLLIYRRHLDLMTSRKLLIAQKGSNFQFLSYISNNNVPVSSEWIVTSLNIKTQHPNKRLIKFDLACHLSSDDFSQLVPKLKSDCWLKKDQNFHFYHTLHHTCHGALVSSKCSIRSVLLYNWVLTCLMV